MKSSVRLLALAAAAQLAFALGVAPAVAGSAESPETLGVPPKNILPDERVGPLQMPETIPPVSADADLVAYQPEEPSSRRHWLDRRSISIEPPYVRATIVVESSSGARTISHYGFDCDRNALALLAMGGRDGGWREVGAIEWQSVTQGRRHAPYLIAIYKAVCQGGGPTPNVDMMLERLQRSRMVDPF